MRRKLIQHGLSSLTLSLPRKWVKEKELKKGDEIEVAENSGNLVLSLDKTRPHRKIEIDLSGAGTMLKKILGATYKTGYDEVKIKFSNPEELEKVRTLIREQFRGFEIMSQSKGDITIKNVAELNFKDFDDTFKRFFTVINQVSEESFDAISKNDFEWAKNITFLKKEIDRYADYCRRMINLGYSPENKRIPPLYTIIEQLEKVSDNYKELCRYISEKKIILDNDLKRISREISDFLGDFYFLYYNFSFDKAIELGNKKEKIQTKIDSALLKGHSKEIIPVVYYDRILNLIFDLNGPLMAINI
jgi:phosphate uptake regulator